MPRPSTSSQPLQFKNFSFHINIIHLAAQLFFPLPSHSIICSLCFTSRHSNLNDIKSSSFSLKIIWDNSSSHIATSGIHGKSLISRFLRWAHPLPGYFSHFRVGKFLHLSLLLFLSFDSASVPYTGYNIIVHVLFTFLRRDISTSFFLRVVF